MKNTMADIHSILMEELDRLNNMDLKGNELKEEIARSQAISKVASNLINNGNLALSTARFIDEQLSDKPLVPSFMASDVRNLGA